MLTTDKLAIISAYKEAMQKEAARLSFATPFLKGISPAIAESFGSMARGSAEAKQAADYIRNIRNAKRPLPGFNSDGIFNTSATDDIFRQSEQSFAENARRAEQAAAADLAEQQQQLLNSRLDASAADTSRHNDSMGALGLLGLGGLGVGAFGIGRFTKQDNKQKPADAMLGSAGRIVLDSAGNRWRQRPDGTRTMLGPE